MVIQANSKSQILEKICLFFAFPEEILALHLALETSDVSVAEILAELLHLLQLQQVDPQHLDRSDHLKKEGAVLGDNTSR